MALLFTGDSDALDKLTSHYGALERSYIFFVLHCKNSLGYPVKLYCTRVTSILRTFDFFLKFLPLKDSELVRNAKKWGVTDFVLERTCPEEHLNLSKSSFVGACKFQNIAIRALKGNVRCHICVKWTY